MTLSIGNVIRKVNPTNVDEFVENESHIIFEVVGTGSVQRKDSEGVYSSVTIVEVKPIQ